MRIASPVNKTPKKDQIISPTKLHLYEPLIWIPRSPSPLLIGGYPGHNVGLNLVFAWLGIGFPVEGEYTFPPSLLYNAGAEGGFGCGVGTCYRRLVSSFTFTENMKPQEGAHKVILLSLIGYHATFFRSHPLQMVKYRCTSYLFLSWFHCVRRSAYYLRRFSPWPNLAKFRYGKLMYDNFAAEFLLNKDINKLGCT